MRISDTHTDFLTNLDDNNLKDYIKKLKYKKICSAVFTTESQMSINKLNEFKIKISNYNKRYKLNLIFCVEDISFLKQFEIENFIKLKPFYVSLTWNFSNQFAGGALSNVGLSKTGKNLITKFERNNIIIDTAHLNKKSFYEFCKISSKPIFNSHSNIFSLYRHKRNLTDVQIKKIVESNGFLGLTLYKNFITKGKFTSFEIAKQFDYLIRHFGYKNFGFGSDLYGFNAEYLPTDIKTYKDLKKVAVHLKNMGYSNKIIKCLFYKNFENFLKRI